MIADRPDVVRVPVPGRAPTASTVVPMPVPSTRLRRTVLVAVLAAAAWACHVVVQPPGAPAQSRDGDAAVQSTRSTAVLVAPAAFASRVPEWRNAPVPVLPGGIAGPVGLAGVVLVLVLAPTACRCRSLRTGFAGRAPPVGSVSLVSL
jgi:hypothetical protein